MRAEVRNTIQEIVMPYVLSEKNDHQDRVIIDEVVEKLAEQAADNITQNILVVSVYTHVFEDVSYAINSFLSQGVHVGLSTIQTKTPTVLVAAAICEVAEQYDYEGAFLGELNYAITRFIQRVPQIKVARDDWDKEFRYWYYARTAEALKAVSLSTMHMKIGIAGVYEDVKDEYKRRVNVAYEAEQVINNGDCYDTPYYTKLVEVIGYQGEHIGYQEVMVKRSEKTVNEDSLDAHFILHKNSKA